MIILPAETEKIKEWFPDTFQSFIEELRNSKSPNKDVPEEDFRWSISWGFYVKKAKTEEEMLQQRDSYQNKMTLPYEERVALEMPRIKCSVSFKAHSYVRTDRIIDPIPDFVLDMSKEVLKITMLQEQSFFNYPNVVESLSGFANIFNEEQPEEEITMDGVLDKINATGMQSLSAQELRFLESLSKN